MNKYFELQYWLTIIALIVTGLFILGAIIWFISSCIINTYKQKSKNWEYNCILNRWEKVNKNEKNEQR